MCSIEITTLAENSEVKNGNLYNATLVAINDDKYTENSKEPTVNESRDTSEDNDITIIDIVTSHYQQKNTIFGA